MTKLTTYVLVVKLNLVEKFLPLTPAINSLFLDVVHKNKTNNFNPRFDF